MKETIKTVLLLTILTVILIELCGLIGSLFHLGSLGFLIGFIIAMGSNIASYFYSDTIALKSCGAQLVSENEAPELHRIVGELANNAGIKKPRVAIMNNQDPNAFATGRNQDHAVVAVTTSLLNLLTENELKGVLSHELGHIKNKDILISSVVATIAGIIVMIGNMLQYGAMFSGIGGNDSEGVGNIIGMIALSILAPIAATVVQLAISRSREFKADETGAKICGHPEDLANALRKIDLGVQTNPMEEAKQTNAHMFIINPFGNASSTFKKLFSTHPQTSDRIKRLNNMTI
ncbi:MAG: zinc metalloprotease HtpX [Methanobacteriaceae archaeon]|nr:zinc metalloprotease HtpX [Methanobacteriaceae archaeon]